MKIHCLYRAGAFEIIYTRFINKENQNILRFGIVMVKSNLQFSVNSKRRYARNEDPCSKLQGIQAKANKNPSFNTV